MIVLDTTVLVYAVGSPHPLAAPCRALVELIGDGTVHATSTMQVIQEFAHIQARRRGRTDAARLAQRYATLLAPLLAPGEDDLEAGLATFARQERLDAFDAVLVATARRAGAAALVSADHGFEGLEEPAVLHPGSGGFLDRVRAQS